MTLKLLSFPAILAAGIVLVSGTAHAQNGPANLPPDGFEGREFVDNAGCIYVRAGVNGSTTWVPRVTRDREPLCDQTPSFPATTAAAPPPEPEPSPGPTPAPVTPVIETVEIDSDAFDKGGSGVVAPPVEIARAPASKPAAAMAPLIVRRFPSVSHPVMSDTCVACDMGGAPYETVHTPVIHPAPKKKAPKAKAVASRLPGHTVIVPLHVYKAKKAREGLHVPAGYMPAWSDDRLNPYRAYQTVDGFYATQKIWTNTVPRKLVATSKKHKPKVKDPVIAYHVDGHVPRSHGYGHSYGHDITYGDSYRTPMMSSRSSKPAIDVRWVEIGVFTTNAKAADAAARLQKHGLAVQLGKVSKGGQTLHQLRVGPYKTHSALNAALAATHKAGYMSAYIR